MANIILVISVMYYSVLAFSCANLDATLLALEQFPIVSFSVSPYHIDEFSSAIR